MKNLFLLALLFFSTLVHSQEDIFKVVEEMPRFPGCETLEGDTESKRQCANEKLIQFIVDNLKYPPAAREAGIEGMVVIQFIVDTDGSIDDAKIVRDIGGGCGTEALRVVNNMNHISQTDTIITFDDKNYTEEFKIISNDINWRPGFQRGKAVKVLYTLPIKYKLPDESAKVVTAEENTNDQYAEFTPVQESPQFVIPALVRKAFAADPVDPSKVVGDVVAYGRTLHPILKVMASHSGIDFRAVPGVEVTAAGNGSVLFAGEDGSKYGNYVILRHDDRTTSLYAHLSEINVNEGQSIVIGELIGKVGQSGKASYPHLHFEVLIDGNPVNPRWEQKQNIEASDLLNDETSKSVEVQSDNERQKIFLINGELQDKGFSLEYAPFTTDDIKELSIYKGDKAKEKFDYGPNVDVIDIQLKEDVSLVAPRFELEQNRPNPTSGKTIIAFHLPNSSPAALYFYNSVGEHLYSITSGLNAGHNEITVSKSQLNTTGLVYYFLVQGEMTKTNKMMIN